MVSGRIWESIRVRLSAKETLEDVISFKKNLPLSACASVTAVGLVERPDTWPSTLLPPLSLPLEFLLCLAPLRSCSATRSSWEIRWLLGVKRSECGTWKCVCSPNEAREKSRLDCGNLRFTNQNKEQNARLQLDWSNGFKHDKTKRPSSDYKWLSEIDNFFAQIKIVNKPKIGKIAKRFCFGRKRWRSDRSSLEEPKRTPENFCATIRSA